MSAISRWDLDTARVCNAMADHTAPMVTPIARNLSFEDATPCGTGSYIFVRGKVYMLTNEHVARNMELEGLTHYPSAGDYAHRFINPFVAMTPPVDAALSRIDAASWTGTTKQALATGRLALKHDTFEHDLLFIQGFPGEFSRWSALAEGLVMRSVPYLTQEAPPPPNLEPFWFALHYSPEHARSIDEERQSLPLPPGFSGSLVWNTHFLEYESQGRTDWGPEKATVTELVCSWGQGSSADLIFAVRIEVVREFLLLALRQEAAYFHWLNRGSPLGSPLADWVAAKIAIKDLA